MRIERPDPRFVRVADQEVAAIDARGAAVVRIGGTQLAALVLLVGIVCVRHEAIDVDDDVVEVDREVFARAEVRLDLLEADDVGDRLTDVGADGPQALRDQVPLGARPEDLPELGARDRAARAAARRT